MLVKELMAKYVYTLGPDASLREVGKMLKEKKIDGIPIVDESQTLIGIVTLTDMLRILDRIYQMKVLEQQEKESSLSDMFEEDKEKAKVQDIMTKDVVTLKEDDTLDDVMDLMFEHKIHTIPVIRGEKLVGVIGKRDIIYACF